ncbi:MAG: F0F1 ATP synthase subunit A [Deltaproteobacteria bacterium]|nr:F0F1 ATP synthase subunit A [Deltaproteobacteria bacterium]
MGYHYFFINEILSSLGYEHFAHKYEQVTHSWLIMLFMMLGAALFTRGLRLFPKKGQNVFELMIDGLENFMIDITGPEGRFFFPFIATLFFYILICNLIGLMPGFYSPTANLNTTLSLAVCTFGYTHIIGIRFHGIKYCKQFLGPVWPLAPLMLPIELIGHFARVMSLSIRLFGNIFGKETVLGILFMLAGLYFAPLPILFLGILVSLIQALVFMLLSTIYFVGAMEEAH